MQKQAKLTSKGQVTIPRAVRQALGLRPGDRLVFEQDETGMRVRPVRSESRFRKYRGIGNPGIPSGRSALIQWLRDIREP
jgi:AbrB family looped-hinge helix DNA binding protein